MMPTRLNKLAISLASLLLVSAAAPGRAPAPGPLKLPAPLKPVAGIAGPFTLVFTERGPFASIDQIVRRNDIQLHETDRALRDYDPSELEHIELSWRYDLADFPFTVIVPAGYRAGNAHGLFVWMGPDDIPPAWHESLARQKLIFICAPRASGRTSVVQQSLALDAVHNMQKRYKLDSTRIYVAGFSGGAQLASWLVRAYPDVFSGGYFLMGGWFYESIEGITGWFHVGYAREHVLYPSCDVLDPQWKGPLEKIKKNMKLVLLRGENDESFHKSLQDDRIQVQGLLLDGFVRSSYIQVPGLGHQYPDATWFEKGIVALESAPKPAPTTAPTQDPNPLPDQITQAKRILTAGEHNGSKTLRYAQRVLKEFPTTPAAQDAQKIVDLETGQQKKTLKKK